MTSQSDIVHDFLLGFIKIHVLYHASRESVYGKALIEELGRHGYQVGPSTIYPLLRQLEQAHYLQREERLVEGKIRKYYRITVSGQSALDTIQAKIRELVAEVL